MRLPFFDSVLRKKERRIINQKKAVKQNERCSYILSLRVFFSSFANIERDRDKVVALLLNNDKTNLKCIYIYDDDDDIEQTKKNKRTFRKLFSLHFYLTDLQYH